MADKHGSLSINSENIFPIIKKWLYSDHDIFFRELVSNGCDAITKLKKLALIGEYTYPEDHKDSIRVIVNPEEKTRISLRNIKTRPTTTRSSDTLVWASTLLSW